MVVGGLAPRETNKAISITFDDINLVKLALQPTFLMGAQDIAPTIQPLGTINLTPGQVFSIPLIATDPNGAPMTMTVETNGNLPTGSLTGENTLILKPTPAQLGSYTFTLVAKQGLLTSRETVTVNVIADAITTTRLSGKVNSDKLTPLGGAVIDVGGVQTTTNADGSFLLELPTDATTVKINGVTQQLSQLLGHQLYGGVNNQVGETIYIPTVDTSGSQTNGNVVTNTNLPQVTLTLFPDTLHPSPDTQISKINSNLIPTDLFTTGTPKSLVAVTMTGTLTTPGKLTLGNDFTVDPGTMMDLWRIDVSTGIPTIVGVGKVSADGKSIDTLSGGVMGAGWYYYVPTPVAQQSPDDNAYNPISTLDIAPVTVSINSEANLLSGKVTDTYQLQGYQSLGTNQSWQLSYSSERANPEQLVNFQYKAFAGNQNNGVFAKLILKTGDFSIASPNYQWRFNEAPTAATSVDGSLKLDTSGLKSGIYTYDLAIGLNGSGDLNATSQNRTRGTLIHVAKSAFGAGWGLAGLQQIVFNDQQGVITAANLQNESLLLIDGNGTQQIFTVINRAANGDIEYGGQFGNPSTLKRLASDGSFERKLIDGTLYKFDNKGLLISLKDRHQNETKFEYDPTNNIIKKIIDPVNLATYFVNNGSEVTQIIDPAGRSTYLNYLDDNLVKVTDPDTSNSRWTYNDKNLMTASTDKLGRTGTDEYDDLGKVISAVRKDGSRVDFVSVLGSSADSYIITNANQINAEIVLRTSSVNYSDRARVKSVDGNGNVTTTTFDKFGQAIKIEDTIGAKNNIYDSHGLLTQTIDELGNKTSYGYNDRNQVTEIAYGDKLSTVQESPILYESSTGGGNITATNFIAYANDTNPNSQYLITSDKAGNIISRTVDNEGTLATTFNRYSLRQMLGGAYDKLTVKKLLVGDFDGDTKQDIAVGYSREVFNDKLTNYLSDYTAFTGGVTAFNGSPIVYTNDAGILILKGNGDGTFNPHSNKIINPATNRFDVFQFDIADLVAVDFNHDNRLDLAVANFISPGEANWTGEHNHQLYLLSNDGSGKFNSAAGNDAINRAYKPFKSVDYKGLLATVKNGNDNLLVVASPNANLNSSNILIYSVNSLGELDQQTNYDIPGLVNDIKTSDLNGDGVDEVILNAGRIYVIDPRIPLNATNPQASTFTTQNTGFWSFMDVADVNGDGIKDVVVANDNSTLKIFVGDNTGGGMTKFNTAPQIYQGTASPRGLMLKDLNGDSRPDIIVGDAFAGFNIKLHTQPLVPDLNAGVVHKSFEYDPIFGQLTKSIDELGRTTIYELNSVGDITKITKKKSPTDNINTTPDSVTTFTYIPGATSISKGLVDEVTDIDGHVTKNSYDTYGRLTNVQQGFAGDLKLVSKLKYEDAPGYNSKAGNVTEKIDGNGKITKYTYQSNTNRIKTETYDDSLGSNKNTQYQYDAKGELISAINSDGYGQKFKYDALGRVNLTTNLTAKGTTIQQTTYDPAGNISNVSNINNATPDAATGLYPNNGDGINIHNVYDARNRLVEVQNLTNNSHTQYQYDKLNNLIKEVDGVGNETDYEYTTEANDSRTRLTKVTKKNPATSLNPDGKNLVTISGYNQALQITSLTDSDNNGNLTQYTYDGLGRQKQVTQKLDLALENGATEIINSTEYFNNGNIKSVTNGNSKTTSYTYNGRNLKETSTDALGTVTAYTYDDAGNVIEMITSNPNLPGIAKIKYGYDALNRQNKVIDALNQETITTYDLSGNITKVEDANHNITEYEYQAASRTITTKNAEGERTVSVYDQLGRIQTVTQQGDLTTTSDDRITSYEYNLANNTTTVHSPTGLVEITQLDSVGNIKSVIKVVNGVSQTTGYDYDGLNHVIKMTDAEGNTQVFGYDKLGHLTSTTAKDSQTNAIHTTLTQTNNLGWKTQTTNAEGQVFKNSYDGVGNVVKQIENNLRTTRFTYDAINRLTNTHITSTIDNLAIDTHQIYDAVGNVISSTDAQQHTTNFKYDDLNRRIKTIDAKTQTIETKYDPVGNVLEVITAPLGTPHKVQYRYDKLNRRIDVIDGEGIDTHTNYNKFGEISEVIENYTPNVVNDPNASQTKYEYEYISGFGRKVSITDASGHTTSTQFDQIGNTIWTEDGNNNRTSYHYDVLNRRIDIVNANNIQTQQNSYDGFGNITAIKDAGGNITRYEYDKLNRQTQMTDPHGKSVVQEYDGLSRVKLIKDRNNTNTRQREFTYDINDNLLIERWDNGTQLTFTYDKVGNLTSSNDSSSNTQNIYNYNEIYQLTDKTTGSTSFHYGYDVYGDLTQRQDWLNNGQVATLDYTYDKNHQLTHLIQTGANLAAQDIGFSYDKFNQLQRTIRQTGNGTGKLVTDYQYTDAGLLADIHNHFDPTAVSPSKIISNYHYEYDPGNRLVLTTGTDGNSAVNYGKDNQLSGIDNATRPDEAYSFNALGVRGSWSTVAGDSRQVLSDGKYEYTYDGEGNLSRKKEISTGNLTNYSWDYRNRLTRVTSGTQTVEYGYDAEDKRVSKKINGVTTEKYVYDGADIALVVGAAGTIVERYLYGDGTDNVLSRESGGAVVWSLADRQGSVVDLVDEQGTVLNHFVYDGFGNRSGSTTADFRYGYTGRELDGETGLYYYRARYYDPSVGRFISEDPAGFGAGDTNLYRYVGNNSTNATDPTGMWELPSWNDITQPFQVAGQFWGGVIADGATNFRNTVTTNAQTGLEYWAGVAVQGQNEGNIWKQIAGTAGGLLSSLATEDNIDKTNETLAFAFGGGVIAAGGEALAGLKLTKTLATAIATTSWVKAATPFVKAATPWVTGTVKSGLAFAGGYQGGTQLRQAWTGEAEDGRQLSTAERWVIGATGVATIASTFLGLKPTQCFVAGTEIQTINGTKNIEDIHVGDWVLSDDPNTVGEIEYKQVLNTFVKDTSSLVDIYIDGEKITTTEEHPFWVPNLGWVAAKDLHAGSLLQTKYESWLDVDKVEKHGGLTTVYNFEVQGFHTYFVSDLGLLVHNTCKIDSLYGDLRDPIPNRNSYQEGHPYAGIKDFEIGSNGKVIVNPELQIIRPGGKAAPLQDGKNYLWVIDESGNLRIGVEAPITPGSPNALGHPTLVEGGKARVGGEIRYEDGWYVNDNSGRYSKGRTREQASVLLDNAHRLMENAGLTGLRKEYRR
jgi:RHS repeat-associated protein